MVFPSLRPMVISSRTSGTTVVFPSSSEMTSLNIPTETWLGGGHAGEVETIEMVPPRTRVSITRLCTQTRKMSCQAAAFLGAIVLDAARASVAGGLDARGDARL